MVGNFNLIRTPKILFGKGQAEELPAVLRGKGRNVLVITGSRSHLQYPVLDKVWSVLRHEGIIHHTVTIEKEPSPDDVDQIVKMYRPIEPDAIVAVGGGSVIDSGKAVSAMMPVDGSVRDYLEAIGTRIHPGRKKYFIAMPTTSGTGSEATANAVLSETGEYGYKRSLRHENLVPDIAIIDPELTMGCPADVTAASGMDAFTQLVESYLSTRSNPLTDVLALEGIDKVHAFLVKAVRHGNDIEARSAMAYAALLSGITLANAGLGLIHGYASSIGGFFRVPHGVICSTMMGVVNRYTVKKLLQLKNITPAHEKYALLGRLFSEKNDKSRDWYMHYAVDYIDELTEVMKMKRLGSFGIQEADLEKIAGNTDHKAHPLLFEKDLLIAMLRERL
jgi:alcohol dehydrogenase class IV